MNDELIIALVEKFSEGSIAELEYRDERTHIVLRKEAALNKISVSHISDTHTVEPAGVSSDAAGTSKTAEAKPAAKGDAIVSPLVATFYTSPRPESPPFVNVGSKVKAGDTLCILEAMKMMNHLEAEFDCEILAVRAKSGDLVEYGQVLFEVKKL